MATVEGIQYPFVCAITVEDRNYVVIRAVLDRVFNKQESGPKVVDRFLGILPHIHQVVYISGGPELLGEYRLWWVGGLNFGSCPTYVFGARMASEVTGSGPVKRKGSGNPTLGPESGGRKVPSKVEVSGLGDSGTRTYLVLNMGREVSVAGSSAAATKWVSGG